MLQPFEKVKIYQYLIYDNHKVIVSTTLQE